MICINSVNVYPNNIVLKKGEWYYGISVEICPTNASCKNVTWYSDNADVAAVNASSGYIYAVDIGTAKIYAVAADGSGCKNYITVTVNNTVKISSITLSNTNLSLEEGNTYSLTATIYPENATYKTLSWNSSNTNVVTVDNGVVHAVAKGTAIITATAIDGSGKYAICDISVTGDTLVTSVIVSPSSKTLTVGNSVYLTLKVLPTNADNKNVLWSSSNTNVITVNPNSGLIHAKNPGVANIYATAQDNSGKRGTCRITVNSAYHVNSVMVCPQEITMNAFSTIYLSATICPAYASNKSVIWQSSNPNVATVGTYTGMVTAISSGTVTITATTVDGGHKSSCIITVISKEKVIIRKDTVSFYIQFLNGLIWKNVGYDLSKTNTLIPQTAKDRSNENLSKTFSEKQIAFLYLFDPLGVEHYVKYYYLNHEIDIAELLFFKDRIYKEIYGVKPQLFRVLPNGTINYYNYPDNASSDFRKSVYSYAEILFGWHTIVDSLSIAGFIYNILEDIFTSIPVVSGVLLAVELYQALFFSGSVNGILSSGVSNFIDNYVSSTYGTTVKDMLGWSGALLNVLSTLGNALADSFSPPNINDIAIYNKVKTLNYQSDFIINGCGVSIDDIINRCIT